MVTRRALLRWAGGGVCAGAVGVAGCSGEGGVEGVELANVTVDTLAIGVRVIVDYSNATDEEVTAETTVDLTVGEGDAADTYEKTQTASLLPRQNSRVEVVFSDEALLGGIDDRIDATVRTAFPEADTEPPTPYSCTECTD